MITLQGLSYVWTIFMCDELLGLWESLSGGIMDWDSVLNKNRFDFEKSVKVNKNIVFLLNKYSKKTYLCTLNQK